MPEIHCLTIDISKTNKKIRVDNLDMYYVLLSVVRRNLILVDFCPKSFLAAPFYPAIIARKRYSIISDHR